MRTLQQHSVKCKEELLALGAQSTIREVSARMKDGLLSEFLNHVSRSLSNKVRSREEILDTVLSSQIWNAESSALKAFDLFNPYETNAPTSPVKPHKKTTTVHVEGIQIVSPVNTPKQKE